MNTNIKTLTIDDICGNIGFKISQYKNIDPLNCVWNEVLFAYDSSTMQHVAQSKNHNLLKCTECDYGFMKGCKDYKPIGLLYYKKKD